VESVPVGFPFRHAERRAALTDASRSPIRVLVVDDEVDFATALALRLRRRGFAADAVFAGAVALQRAAAGDVDVLVLDLRMPGMDGLETLRAVRAAAPGVRVIVLTGHGTVASGIEGMQIGAADFLQKPADIETLSAAIIAAAARPPADDDAGDTEEGGA
jgi:DNA-binding response OmpR family regulator